MTRMVFAYDRRPVEAAPPHEGEMLWMHGQAPAPVIGPCPHDVCPHNVLTVVAEGPDNDHAVLNRCDVVGGCQGRCRAWAASWPSEGPLLWAPFLHVDIGDNRG